MAATTSDSDALSGEMDTRFDRWRIPALAGLAVVVIGSLALLAYGSVKREKADGLRSELDAIVDDFSGQRSIYNFSGGDVQPNIEVAEDQVKKLEELRPRTAGTELEPYVLLQLAIRQQLLGRDAEAIASLDDIRKGHPEASILKVQSFDSDRTSLVDRITGTSRKRMEFAAKHVDVVPKADPARYAIVETDLGAMKVLFYKDLAPKHVDAFIALAKSGGFNGTKLYSVRRGEVIEMGGGERTRNTELRDDREDDPAMALPPELASRNHVKHRRRMVTSAPLLSGDQGDRFAVVLAETKPDFDSMRTPFGELLDDDSAAVADRLGNALTFGADATYVDRREKTDYPNTPSRPVTIRRVSIWKEGAIESGHTWDTARVNTDQPEPEAVKPSDEPKKVEEPKKDEKGK